MTRIFSLLLSVPLAVIVVLFAVSNLQNVTVSTFPLPFELTLPLALLVLGAMAISFLLGSILTWLMATPTRVKAYREAVRAARLEKELAALRAATLSASSRDAPPPSGAASTLITPSPSNAPLLPTA